MVNVGGFDLAAGLEYLQQVIDSTNIPFISANIIDSRTNQKLFPPHHIIENDNISIGIIGLTNLIPSHTDKVKVEDFITVGKAQIDELRNKVDIVVVLANVNRDKNEEMNEEFRIKWPRGELGALPDDAVQDLNIEYLQEDVKNLQEEFDEHVDEHEDIDK